MNHSKDSDAPKKEKSIPGAVYAGASVASVLTGGVAARAYINNAAYDTLKEIGALTDITAPHHEAIDGLVKKKLGTDKTIDFVKKFCDVKNEHYPKIAERTREMGIKGMVDEWKLAHTSQHLHTIVIGMTVSSVMIGACLEVARAMNDRANRNDEISR